MIQWEMPIPPIPRPAGGTRAGGPDRRTPRYGSRPIVVAVGSGYLRGPGMTAAWVGE
jgi:hypothetical protein